MSDDAVLAALKEYREETRAESLEQRKALTRMADALADLGKTLARSEERHSGQEATLKRIGAQLDDHEARIRVVERHRVDPDLCKAQAAQILTIKEQLSNHVAAGNGSWRAITAIGAVVGTVIGLILAAVNAL